MGYRTGVSGRSSLLTPSLGDAMLRVAGGYAMLAAAGLAGAVLSRGELPLLHPSPWLPLAEAGYSPHLVGLAAGAFLALALIASTRFASARFVWARRLERDLAPLCRELDGGRVAVLALLSGVGEEVFFRGLLATLLGVVASSALFGLAHQLPGRSRWVWVAWATVAGLLFALVYRGTGSLVAPIVAHVLVNFVNLLQLRER